MSRPTERAIDQVIAEAAGSLERIAADLRRVPQPTEDVGAYERGVAERLLEIAEALRTAATRGQQAGLP